MNRFVGVLTAVSVLVAACGDSDDGAGVRDDGVEIIGEEDGSESASASASGSASAPASGSASAPTATGGDGGYDYATDVAAHRLVTMDVCEINDLLGDDGAIDFPAVEAIYRDGKNSVNADGSVRSLGGFAAATDRLHGLDAYYGTPTPLDDFVSSALAGTGQFEGEDELVRRQGVQKGIQSQIMVAWVIHELNSALAKAADGDFDPAEGAVHNWDEAWAFYHGAEPGCAPHATAQSRAENFGTLAADGETARTNEAITAAMVAGRDALLADDAAGAEAAAAEVLAALVTVYSQAAVRYATVMDGDLAGGDAEAARVHQAEGWAFWRTIEALAADAGADVAAVNGVFDLADEPSRGGADIVTAALQPAWDSLGITAEDIGQLQ